jgi:hypothetical protein
MGAIAERLDFRVAAAAQRNDGTACEAERLAGRIANFELPFNPQRTVVQGGDFGRHRPDGSTRMRATGRREGDEPYSASFRIQIVLYDSVKGSRN